MSTCLRKVKNIPHNMICVSYLSFSQGNPHRLSDIPTPPLTCTFFTLPEFVSKLCLNFVGKKLTSTSLWPTAVVIKFHRNVSPFRKSLSVTRRIHLGAFSNNQLSQEISYLILLIKIRFTHIWSKPHLV